MLYLLSEGAASFEPAQRIVALSPHLVEQLYSLGVGDMIVGTTDHADYPEGAKNIPRVGNYAQLQVEKNSGVKTGSGLGLDRRQPACRCKPGYASLVCM